MLPLAAECVPALKKPDFRSGAGPHHDGSALLKGLVGGVPLNSKSPKSRKDEAISIVPTGTKLFRRTLK
jgi:hypothetical protein